MPLDDLLQKRIGAFSGIAVPESFEGFLRGFGANLLYTKRFLDHHRFDADELGEIFNEAVDADLDFIVTTEKDAVRIPEDQEFLCPVFLAFGNRNSERSRGLRRGCIKICFSGSERGSLAINKLA